MLKGEVSKHLPFNDHACYCESFQLFENIMECMLLLQLLKIFKCMSPHWSIFINCGTKFCPSHIEMKVMSLSVYNLQELSIQLGNICILLILSVLLNDAVIPTFI